MRDEVEVDNGEKKVGGESRWTVEEKKVGGESRWTVEFGDLRGGAAYGATGMSHPRLGGALNWGCGLQTAREQNLTPWSSLHLTPNNLTT